VVELTCESVDLDQVGRVVDFGVVKAIVGKWIDDNLDHTTIVNREDINLMGWCTQDHLERGKRKPYVMPGEPTAENLAKHLLEVAQDLLGMDGLRVSKVRVYETPNCYADYEAPR
jgi:6-pyruvoyltetrahydropterin/6-carboxytetrahydropterin synthase